MTDSRRQEIERLVWSYGDAVHFYGNQGDKVAAAMDAVSSAIDALLKDAERVDWMETHPTQIDHRYPIVGNMKVVWTYRNNFTGFIRDASDLRSAIDAAIAGGEGNG
jgi:hypothetical protein